mmetsp:Transcript_55412/g.110137  ORF Transcript_55412/g.110137 Transcript_55412/m.110137 type:complete len:517 (-) Transcript_55412:189-1739(-)|eukprot:CAMPEP_0172658392 /NCGR_PEP_ID=MMETSP1074-20121228/2761_1 /TAXON_ID=2916 /ORGANISM="Ceratium fusus, Strain PA161109" /LENGTH=516 /DNA_ID=CAMNT_0013473685 /DNA_START=28 /DNA_END=1578 /DNA_ORIENTATION=-
MMQDDQSVSNENIVAKRLPQSVPPLPSSWSSSQALPLANRATSALHSSRREGRSLSVSSGIYMRQHVQDQSMVTSTPLANAQVVRPPQGAETPIPSLGRGSYHESQSLVSSSKSCSFHEQLVLTARALDKALTMYWNQRGMHVTVADHWSHFFDEAVTELGYTSSPDSAARLTVGDLEAAMRKRFVVGHACDDLVASGVTRADLHTLFNAVDTCGRGRVTSFDWQMRLYKLEFASLTREIDEVSDATPATCGAGLDCSLPAGIQAASSLVPEVGCVVQSSSAEDRVAEVCLPQCSENTSKPQPVSERGTIGTASFVAQLDTPSKPPGTRQDPGSTVKRRRTGKSKPPNSNDAGGFTKDSYSITGALHNGGNQVDPEPRKNVVPGTGIANHVMKKTSQQVHSNTAELLEFRANTNSMEPWKQCSHTNRPKEQGRCVAVIGNGWGDGDGGYQAIVTEADDLTFTVVMVDSAGRWEETHVLKSCCILLEGEVHSFSHRKFAASASPHCKVEPCKVEPCM